MAIVPPRRRGQSKINFGLFGNSKPLHSPFSICRVPHCFASFFLPAFSHAAPLHFPPSPPQIPFSAAFPFLGFSTYIPFSRIQFTPFPSGPIRPPFLLHSIQSINQSEDKYTSIFRGHKFAPIRIIPPFLIVYFIHHHFQLFIHSIHPFSFGPHKSAQFHSFKNIFPLLFQPIFHAQFCL